MTDQTERQLVAEFIREKALRTLDKEVPHGIAVEIESFEQKSEDLVHIGAVIYCEKESHKAIIIGKGGAMLKKIASAARVDMERLLGCRVYLEIFVKVKLNWRQSDAFLKNMGLCGVGQMEFSARGLVLAERTVGEWDKSLTLLCEGIGKMSAWAKGAKRVKSPLLSACSMFTFGSYSFVKKGGEGHRDLGTAGGDLFWPARGCAQAGACRLSV